MQRNQKATIVDKLRDRADKASIAVVTDFKGLRVEELTDLRVKLRQGGVDYQIVKNTLARLAVKDGRHKVLGPMFKENCAVAFGYGDPVQAAKLLMEYAKTNKKFVIRFGSLEGKLVDEQGVKDLSSLPGRNELLGRVLGTMNAVPTNFVGLLANVIRGLQNVLNGIKEKKEAA